MEKIMNVDFGNGTQYEIFKQDNGLYSYNYCEFYASCGWRVIFSEGNYTKDAIEDLTGCKITA